MLRAVERCIKKYEVAARFQRVAEIEIIYTSFEALHLIMMCYRISDEICDFLCEIMITNFAIFCTNS